MKVGSGAVPARVVRSHVPGRPRIRGAVCLVQAVKASMRGTMTAREAAGPGQALLGSPRAVPDIRPEAGEGGLLPRETAK